MDNKVETINNIDTTIKEITTKQFYVGTINKCLFNLGIKKIILTSNDLDLLNEIQLNQLLAELNRVKGTMLKEQIRHRDLGLLDKSEI